MQACNGIVKKNYQITSANQPDQIALSLLVINAVLNLENIIK